MPTVVGVAFKPVTKVYHFESNGLFDLSHNEYVIVDTSRGQEVAQIVEPPHIIDDKEVVGEIKRVVRRASPWDLVQKDQWLNKEREALAVCRHKASEYKLKIKVVSCEYNFNGGRLVIYFAADNRIDFRNLVRELAKIFRTRVEMRQIGVRDEAKLLDGVGKCGRQLCCTSWLREFTPVSIRMAKNQQLPLNPDEISGVCGRLLCCLSYEDATYKEQNRKMPKLGAEVITPQGGGRVRHIHPLKETVTVMLETGVLTEFPVAELVSTRGGGSSCNTCGGCTVKRRASAAEDNEKVRRRRASRRTDSSDAGNDEQSDGNRGGQQRRSRSGGGQRSRQRRSRRNRKDE
ncbi:MAG: stage 0 sporulation family protein [Caldilineaceae bacterium]|nr:stage 0 sporulation family protein [Caldilineaceae bacterium]MCB0096109.1 stage 0 sporulation family protein [Caldilineaceae bacterium]MCB0143965.1 stage 0 sporulation family protein [Caldilineaceae bacterium]